jgi:hypothetical protein
MNPLWVVAIVVVLVIGLSFDQPASSPEQDSTKRPAAHYSRLPTRAVRSLRLR